MQFTELNRQSDNYPALLREIHQAPKQLFVDGEIPLDQMVSIVGTRRPTAYGEEITYKIAYDLAKAGLVVVSGLAIGIDAIAHRAALDAGGKTIAVLGCGLDVNNPAENKSLRDKIPSSGAVISEYKLGTPGIYYNYPRRNRIVAGLSRATLVTEANAVSGALITADLALNNDRMVMAIPGNTTSHRSAGPNNLLKKGAIPITDSTDVLLALGIEKEGDLKTIRADSQEEAAIIAMLSSGVTTTEEIILRLKMSASQFAQIISLMEIAGKVKNLGAGHWSLSR